MSNIKCHKCSHEWDTKSNLVFVSCPSCGAKVKNPRKLKGGKKKDEK